LGIYVFSFLKYVHTSFLFAFLSFQLK
jgi:hypothetical protein